jgi:hypothetical protein
MCGIEGACGTALPSAGVYPLHQETSQLTNGHPHAGCHAGILIGELSPEPGFTGIHRVRVSVQ